jgi:hypothetical protein
VYLYYTNLKKDIKNLEMLGKLATPENPVAIIKPKTAGPRAGKSIAKHFPTSKAPTCAFLCIGARVAINAVNYYPTWGLYNGACGSVVEIVFAKPNANPNEGDIPDYVVVDFPSYRGPPWDICNPTHIPIPRAYTTCSKQCCSREVTPLIPAWAITIHRFQGLSAGKVDQGKIPNPYDCIVCDPHHMSAEKFHLGLFYTALSRATTLGNVDGLHSAFYFITNAKEERFRNIGRKKDSVDYYISYIKRSTWVKLLTEHTYTPPQSKQQLQLVLDWALTTQYDPSSIIRLSISRNIR